MLHGDFEMMSVTDRIDDFYKILLLHQNVHYINILHIAIISGIYLQALLSDCFVHTL